MSIVGNLARKARSFITDAPVDGKVRGRKDGEWVEVEQGGGGAGDDSRVDNNLPIGAVLFDPRGIGWQGFLELNGGSFDTGVYPDLAALYPSGVLPDFTDRVPRGAGALAGAAGSVQQDAFQGHKIRVYNLNAAEPRGGGGSVNVWNTNSGQYVESNGQFYTDGVNGTPRVASETRVKAVIGKFYIKAYGAFTNVGDADLVAMEQAVHRQLGWGQAWQVVTADRTLDTIYTNTTGQPIIVSVNIHNSTVGTEVGPWFKVGGVEVSNFAVSGGSRPPQVTLATIVPNGHTYSAHGAPSGNDTIRAWRELR